MNCTAKITKRINDENKSLKAVATVTIDEIIDIYGVRVIDAGNGIFVTMPSTSYRSKESKGILYHPVVLPKTPELRKKIEDAVIKVYEKNNKNKKKMEEISDEISS